MELCDYICGLDDSRLQIVFCNLKLEIEKLIKIFENKWYKILVFFKYRFVKIRNNYIKTNEDLISHRLL